MPIRWHADDPDWLRESVTFTARDLGFTERLVEKDYFCSVLLEYLAANSDELVFKGGTCLSKVHAEFYRLSEDLDFSISMATGTTRPARKKASSKLKSLVSSVSEALPVFQVIKPLMGANGSTQYNAVFGYESLLDGHLEPVRIEVGLREAVLTAPLPGMAKTVLRNPISGRVLVEAYPVGCLSWFETMAEKLRAALCRREVAIRDFFDVDYVVEHLNLDTKDPTLLDLLRQKLVVPGTGEVDISQERLDRLRSQLEAQLRPVLLERNFRQFDLERAFNTVRDVAREVRKAP